MSEPHQPERDEAIAALADEGTVGHRPVSLLGPIPMAGVRSGQGTATVAVPLPPVLPPATLAAQVFVVDPGAPAQFSATNGIATTFP